MKQEITKAEQIEEITRKSQKAIPMVRRLFTGGLKYKTKKELSRINSKMRVSRNGMEISIV